MPEKIDEQVKALAFRLVLDRHPERPSRQTAVEAVARQLNVGKESARPWANEADVDSETRIGVASTDQGEIRKLKAENRRLREDVAILKAATSLSWDTRLRQQSHSPAFGWQGSQLAHAFCGLPIRRLRSPCVPSASRFSVADTSK